MRGALPAFLFSITMLAVAGPVLAAEDPKPAPAAPAAPALAAKDVSADLPPLPPEASVRQTTHVAGKVLAYTATVGALPVRDDKGKATAEVVYTAYTLDGPRDPDRPVTFAFNGGPGAASVFLNLGAIGPRRIEFGAAGDSPSDAARTVENDGTWLDFTDLVFIDPVGTGFSRSLVSPDETKKAFFATRPDIEYLSRIVYDWLLKNGRMASPKYVVGDRGSPTTCRPCLASASTAWCWFRRSWIRRPSTAESPVRTS